MSTLLVRRLGIFARFWRWLFGEPQAVCGARRAPHTACGSRHCGSLIDPRCEAGNCTAHCSMWCPRHRCGKQGPAQEARRVTEQTATLRDMVDLLGAVPQVASIISCACGAKNRVAHKDFGRGPICGKCKKSLRLPS